MTRMNGLLAADRGEEAGRIRLVSRAGLEVFRVAQSELARAAMETADFRALPDSCVFLPGSGATDWLLAVGTGDSAQPGRWDLAVAAAKLPAGNYRLETEDEAQVPAKALHGWLMAQHQFTRYRQNATHKGARRLLIRNPAIIEQAIAEAEIAADLRDMIDTPAEDMGPARIEELLRALAIDTGASFRAVIGDELLARNFPAIHAVGRASPRAPRLLVLEWGDAAHPLLAIVGKGVCFDTGGLNLKPGNSMALMKKDMGGAAHAMALARLVMAAKLPVRLRLVVAAVDNVVAGDALRPGDVIATRQGLHVEVGNTDAEGRLILADALHHAAEGADKPALLIDFATLTGAARVALGPDLPAMFSTDAALGAGLQQMGEILEDPVWQLPLWQPYQRLFKSPIADCNNISATGFAGSIVAALFLQQFVPDGVPWLHFDIYAWNPDKRPGRPKGASAQAIFTAFHSIQERFA